MKDIFRGHKIEFVNNEWIYSDTKEPTVSYWMDRSCGHCGMYNTPEGHDGCLGELPHVINACCGHGEVEEAYVQMDDKEILRGIEALNLMDKLRHNIK